MRYIIDRFEGEFAVVELENKQFANIPRSAIPSKAIEGDIINVEVDKEETEAQEKKIKKLMNDVWTD